MSDKTMSSPTGEPLDQFQFTFELGDQSLIPPRNSPPLDYVTQKYEDETEALPASVTKFPRRFGRTYQAFQEGIYHFPNDLTEQERETRQYQIMHSMMGNRLHLAPIAGAVPFEMILDVCTGVGDWAIAIGDEHPATRVFGFDVSPHQPELVPPNVHFLLQDMTKPWHFVLKIDYIHTRLTASIWGNFKTEFLDQAFESLKPGGWAESQEVAINYDSPAGAAPVDPALVAWISDINEASRAVGRPMDWVPKLKQMYKDAGFVDVHERVFRLPISPWPSDPRLKEIGTAWRDCVLDGLSGFSVALFNTAFGRSQETTEVMLTRVRQALLDPRNHAYNTLYVVWGRKPLLGEVVTQ